MSKKVLAMTKKIVYSTLIICANPFIWRFFTMSKEMTKEEAIEILKGEFSHPNFAEAKRLLENLEPNHPVLRELAEREEAYRKDNAMESDEASVYADNAKDLQEFANDYYASSFSVKKKYMDEISDRVDVYATDEKTGKTMVLSAEKKNDYLSLLFQKSKLETSMALLGNENYRKLSREDKKEVFRSATDDRFFAEVAKVSMASSVRAPKGKELETGSQEQFDYIKALSGQFRASLEDALATKKKIKIHEDAVLISVMDTADRAQAYHTQLKEKARKLGGDARTKLNEVAVRVIARKHKLEEKAETVSNGKYKKIIQSFRQNKFQIGMNAAATLALSLSGYGTVALVAYGAYMAAGSWIHPILNETQKMKDERKEKGLPPMKFAERWHKARVKLAGSKKEGVEPDKKYLRKAAVTSAVSVLSFGLLAKHAAAFQATEDFRKAFSWTRLGVANMAQATETGVTGVRVLKNKNDENAKKEFKSAALGLGIGAGVGAIAQGLREIDGIKDFFGGIFHKDPAAADGLIGNSGVSHAGAENGFPVWGNWGKEPQGNGYIWQPEQEVEGAGNIADIDVQPEVEIERFPTEWNENLDISERRFNIMMSRINNGKIADFDAQSLDRAYMNMDDEFMSHFEGKTKMQVFYDYVELARNGRRHQYVLGNAEHGFFINTPTGRQAITDEGVIEQAKKALANGDKLLISRLHGRSFLQEQFENVRIEGMTDEKMQEAIDIAMKTYDPNQVSGATAEIHKLFPDLTKAQLKTVHDIVDYNREYEQNGALMDQIGRALGCGEKQNLDYENAAKLLDDRYEILSRSNGPSRPISQNGPDCPTSTMLAVRGVPAPVYEVEIPKEELVIVPAVAPLRMPTPHVELLKNESVAQVEEQMGRKYVAKSVSDHWHNAESQESISDEQAEILIKNQEALEKNGIFGIFKMKSTKVK